MAVEVALDVAVEFVGRVEVGDGLAAGLVADGAAVPVGAVVDAVDVGGAGADAELLGVAEAGGKRGFVGTVEVESEDLLAARWRTRR